MPSPSNGWYLPRGANCGFGPLRTNIPRSPGGTAPVTARSWSSRSSVTGAISPLRNGEGGTVTVMGPPDGTGEQCLAPPGRCGVRGGSGPVSRGLAEVAAGDPGVVGAEGRGVAGERDPAVEQHVGPVGHGERGGHVLLHQQHPDPEVGRDRSQQREQLLHDDGCETE